jgi:hypothetical protein
MKANQESATQLAALRESLAQLETGLSAKMDQELLDLCEACNDPVVFLAHMAPTLPDKRVTFTDWAFLCTLLNWDSPHNFPDDEAYQAFLDSIVRAGTAPIEPPIVAGSSSVPSVSAPELAPLVTESAAVPEISSEQAVTETVEG